MSVNLCSLCVFMCGFSWIYCEPIMIASLLPADENRLFNSRKVAPAISIAVDKVTNSTGLLPGREIIVQYADSNCSIADAMNEAINYYVKKHVHVFFGPCCDYAAAPIARQTRYWNIPVVTTGAMARDFGNKHDMFPLLTRMGPNFNSLVNFIVAILKQFHWGKVKLLYEPDGHSHVFERFCHIAADGIHYGLRFQRVVKNLTQEYFKFEHISEALTSLATEIGNNHAVIVLCASPNAVREIMIKAHELNFDNGEYVFFNIDLFSSKNDSERPWFREGPEEEERNEKARLAYESLMTVTLRKPTSPEYKKFSAEVKRRAKEMYENFTYGEEEVNSFVGAFHDAVILYALALNETLEAKIPITNGSEITARMWNRTFEGITGTVSIDDNGDRNADYSLLDMNPETYAFEVVANYYGNKKQYEPVAGKAIHWAGGRDHPPPDTPDCGFDGSKCPPEKPFPEYGIVIIVLGSIILIVLIAAFFIYRMRGKRGLTLAVQK